MLPAHQLTSCTADAVQVSIFAGQQRPDARQWVHLSAVRRSARQAPAASAVERSSLCGRLSRTPGRLLLARAVMLPMLRPTDSGNASVARVEVGPAAGTCTAAASAAMAALQAASLHPGHAQDHAVIVL
jgi:hypothetical protein